MTDPADPHYFARRAAESEAKRRRIVADVARAAGPNDDIDYLTKRELYREIVGRLAAFDSPADHITILLRESALENWGIRGGQAACDVGLGFDVNV